MKESDWKKVKVLKAKCLERFCGDILEHSKSICETQAGDAHARYCEMFQGIRDRDKKIAYAFDSDVKDRVTRLSEI